MHALQSDYWRLWLDPAEGVQWLAAEVRDLDGEFVAVVPDCRSLSKAHPTREGRRPGQDEAAPLPAANFHMIPYSNRIRDGRFHFRGLDYQLGDGERHAIHGALRKRAFTTREASDSVLECHFNSREEEPINWPWPIESIIRYSLEERRLESHITIRNLGDTAMPAGAGWHPYFVRRIGNADVELTLPVEGVFPDTNGDCLPVAPPQALPHALDFRRARALPHDQAIDHCLSGLDGSADIAWPLANIRLRMTASENCRFLVLYNPAMPHFAVEPVTNANDGFNLDQRGIDGGSHVLEPGEALDVHLSIDVHSP